MRTTDEQRTPGGVPPSYGYVPPQRVLLCFSLKTGIDFAYFDPESGIVF